jgi:hypothetical protein
MKKTLVVAGFAIMSLCFAHPLLAQSGCVNSPEDPTVVLALVAGAAVVVTRWKAGRQRN